MKFIAACLLLLSCAASADDQGQAAPPPAAAPAPAAAPTPDATPPLSDNEQLAQQLVRCAVIEQKLGTNDQMTSGWSLSYNGAAVALSSAAFVAAQMVAQAGSADGLSATELHNASAQCRVTMLTNMQQIGAGMKHRQDGAAQPQS
jgi:2-oxoglutarate dehydrogenase E2 component (dihydrolipoamide succinyltransferase)